MTVKFGRDKKTSEKPKIRHIALFPLLGFVQFAEKARKFTFLDLYLFYKHLTLIIKII